MDYHPAGASPEHYRQTVFQARLEPYRSLSPKGFAILNLILLICALTLTFIFLNSAALLVIVFFWLAIGLLYLAFRLNYFSATAYEEITLSRECLDIIQVAASGQRKEYRFNPFWTKFSVQSEMSEEGSDLFISHMFINSKRQKIEIGRFLPPVEKERFSINFLRALNMVKDGH